MYSIRYLDKSYNREMLGILRAAPINTDTITLCFDRDPDFFKMPEIKYDPLQYLGYFRENSLEGFACKGYHSAMINGCAEQVFHLTDIYIKPESRSKGFNYKISDYLFRETCCDSRIGYAVIMDGNKAALSMVGRYHPRFPYVPYSRVINQLHVKSIVLAWPVKPDNSYQIRKASVEDIPKIVELLIGEHKDRLFGMAFSEISFESLLAKRTGLSIGDYYLAEDRSKNICGVCAAWDCNSFKQNRVIRYGRKFLPTRIGHKLLEGIYGLPPLPAPGDAFRDITITDYAVKDRNTDIMKSLLKAIYNDYRKKGYHTLIWGSSADDPLLKAANGFFSESIVSNIVFLATKPELIEGTSVNKNLPYIDVACL